MSFRLVPKSVTMNDLTRRNNSKVASVYPFGLCIIITVMIIIITVCDVPWLYEKYFCDIVSSENVSGTTLHAVFKKQHFFLARV